MDRRLALVRWELGQTLLPDHFEAQEGALLEECALRFRLHGLPAHGIASVQWNDALLREGVLSLTRATIVMPSGHLLDVPANAVTSPLHLDTPGTSLVTAYLHLLADGARDEDNEVDGRDDVVPRRVHRLRLSADPSVSDAVSTLKLAELKKTPAGWRLSAGYVPPLVLVGDSPFLRAELDELRAALEEFRQRLALAVASSLTGSSAHADKQCWKHVHRLQRLLANLDGQVQLHPHHLLEALEDFHVELSLCRGSAPERVEVPYRHEQLAACFARVLSPLLEELRAAHHEVPYAPFRLRDGVYRVDLPAEVKRATEIFLLIQKSDMHRVVAFSEFKLASPSRLLMTHRLSLPGIRIEHVERSQLLRSFGPEVELYRLQPGEEWQHALRDGAVAFQGRAELADLDFHLYWSVG